MNPQDPLANLHPLREPVAIAWWPLAPGWWLLIVIALAALLVLGYLLLRRYRANAYRREALARLQLLRQQYPHERDRSVYLAELNALLKSVALRAYPRRDIAASSGQQWLEFLNGSSKSGERFDNNLVDGAYRRDCPRIDLEQTQRAAATWIRHHEVGL